MIRATFEPFTDRQKRTITEAFARTDIYDYLAKNNMKTYVITLSKKFPINHNRKGQLFRINRHPKGAKPF